jgi:hypothetical protein
MANDSEICFICCKLGADTRDHVLPECFFVPPRPSNLLTLPAHYRCHNQTQEEYFRNIIALLGSENSNAAKMLWGGKVIRSIKRNHALQKSLRTSLRKKLIWFLQMAFYWELLQGLK